MPENNLFYYLVQRHFLHREFVTSDNGGMIIYNTQRTSNLYEKVRFQALY